MVHFSLDKYNENIDFIFKPKYGDFEYHNNLEFLGLFERITKKLYGSSIDFHNNYDKELYSNYYADEISAIEPKLKQSCNIYLNTYIKENKLQLMNIGKKVFDKYISDEYNYNQIQKNVIHDYIYKSQNTEMQFSIKDSLYENNIKEIIIQYIQNPIETAKNLYNKYINYEEKIEYIYFDGKHNKISVKEHIGACLLERQFKDSLLQELYDNPKNDYKKKHDIIQSITDLDAQMLNITIKHDNQIIDFKYPKDTLKNLGFYSSKIPDLTIRDKVEELYKNVSNDDETFIREIAKIEYKKKVVYEDKQLLNLDKTIAKDNPDIVDEMFE